MSSRWNLRNWTRRITRRSQRLGVSVWQPHESATATRTPRYQLESLEQRILLSHVPDAIDPDNAQQALLDVANDFEEIGDFVGLDNLPVPYVITASVGGVQTVVVDANAGESVKIDIDQNKTTGRGGKDLIVTLETVIGLEPSLMVTFERLDGTPFVEDIEVLVSFPFDAFSTEVLPSAPNLFVGFSTSAIDGSSGGYAAELLTIEFVPGAMAGTDHLYDMQFTATGSDNPLTYLMGHFDGDSLVGTLNAAAIAIETKTDDGDVPESVQVGMGTSSALLESGTFQTSFNLDWQASERSDVVISFLEAEDLASAKSDFGTTLSVVGMPTQEMLSVNFTTNSLLTLSHRGNAEIDSMTYRHERRDGALFTVSAQQVPTQVDLLATMSLAGDTAVALLVNDNTMDLQLEAIGGDGFPNIDDLLGINLSYLSLEVDNVVDMFAGVISALPIRNGFVDVNRDGVADLFDNGSVGGVAVIGGRLDLNDDGVIDGNDSDFIFGHNIINGGVDVDQNGVVDGFDNGFFSGIMSATAINPGESIERMQIVVDDDAHYDPITEQLVGLELAPDWSDAGRHILSLVEDGVHGTFAARLLDFQSARFDVNSADLTESFRLLTSEAAPLQAYLRFGEGSAFLSENPNDDIEFTCNIFDLPAGEIRLRLSPPSDFGYEIDPPASIDTIHCFGHIGLTNFDVLIGDLPAHLAMQFDPTAFIRLVADDGMGNPAVLGRFETRLWDTPVAFIEGQVDLNLDGMIDENDMGELLGRSIIGGDVDINEDGEIDADDAGTLLKLNVTDGRIDVDGDGDVDGDDNAAFEDLSAGVDNGAGLFREPLRDVRLRIDDAPSFVAEFGGVTTLAFKLAPDNRLPPALGSVVYDAETMTTAVIVRSTPMIPNGDLLVARVEGDGFGDGNVVRLLPSLNFHGQVAPFEVGDVIVGANSGAMATVRRIDQFDGAGTVWVSDITAAFQDSEALLVGGLVRGVSDGLLVSNGSWIAAVNGEPEGSGTSVRFNTVEEDVYIGGLQLAVSSAVELTTPLPEPDATLAQSILLQDRRSTTESMLPPKRLAFSLFGLDEFSYTQQLENTDLIYDADTARSLIVKIDRDFGGAFLEGDSDQAMGLSLLIDAVPANIELHSSPTHTVYQASSAIDQISVSGLIDEVDDGGALNRTIILGGIDIDDDGDVDGDDNGIYDGIQIIGGAFDLNGDGEIDLDDTGEAAGVSLRSGLVDVNGNLLIDFNDNYLRNGTEFGFNLLGLPDAIDLRFAPGALQIVDGRVNTHKDDETEEDPDIKINGKDSGEFFGLNLIAGKFDIDGNGVIDGDDDGFILDVLVIDGQVDLDNNGVVNDDDDGDLSGAHLSQSSGIDSVAVHATALDGAYGVFGTELRVFSFEAEDIPADLFFVSTPLRTRVAASDELGDPSAFGLLDIFASSTLDPTQLAERTSIFETAADPILGDVLTDPLTPMLIDYSEFAQAIDFRYHDEGGSDGIVDRLRTIYSLGQTLDTSHDHIAARLYGGSPDYLSLHFEGFEEASFKQSSTTFEVFDLDPIEVTSTFDVVLSAPSNGARPLYIGLGQSSGVISENDRGRFDGFRVIGGKVDINNDGEITEDDDGSAGGFFIINGRVDANDDGKVSDEDDRFHEGIRIINGHLDLSETATIAHIENVPDQLNVTYRLFDGFLTLEATDDVDPSPGDVEIYIGPLFNASETDPVTRLLLRDTPNSVDVRWGLDFLNGGVTVNSSNPFEVLGLIQQKNEDGSVVRNVFGLALEDIQIGYDIEFFSFDVVETVELSFGVDIINGRFDINVDGSIDEDDDGSVAGPLGLGTIAVIDGELDINGDGTVDENDDGVVGAFPAIDGRADVNFDGTVNGDDDFTALSIELDSAWELFSAEIGIDNDADDTDIGGNDDKAPISGFLSTYTLTDDPLELDPAGPAPDGREYTPGLTLILDEFREASLESSVWLDLFSGNQGLLPFQVNTLTGVFHGLVIFDFWVPFEVDATFEIDFPDWVPLEDILVGIINPVDYTDNTPIHLLPIIGFFTSNPESLVYTWLGFHEFADHEDPFD